MINRVSELKREKPPPHYCQVYSLYCLGCLQILVFIYDKKNVLANERKKNVRRKVLQEKETSLLIRHLLLL